MHQAIGGQAAKPIAATSDRMRRYIVRIPTDTLNSPAEHARERFRLFGQGFYVGPNQGDSLRPSLAQAVNGMSSGTCIECVYTKGQRGFSAAPGFVFYSTATRYNQAMAADAFTWIRPLGSSSSSHIFVI